MDANDHAVLIARTRDWLDTRVGHPMSVKVHSGGHTEYVASGPYLRLEEQSAAPGVYRAIFDDSLASGPDAPPKCVVFGAELHGVSASAERLLLDKGMQQVEIADLTTGAAAVTADDVWWSEGVKPARSE